MSVVPDTTTVDYATLAKMLRQAAQQVKTSKDLLSQLDSATGDGDHGTTMNRIADAMLETLQTTTSADIPALLEALGWNVMSVDGGSASPLLGSFFTGMAEAAGGKQCLSVPELAQLFEAGVVKLQAQTSAKPGDKTMVDALVPAVAALRQAADAGEALAPAMAKAAAAAVAGAKSTSTMQAKFGRARNLGARTLGHVDPGATSISLIFTGLHEGLAGS